MNRLKTMEQAIDKAQSDYEVERKRLLVLVSENALKKQMEATGLEVELVNYRYLEFDVYDYRCMIQLATTDGNISIVDYDGPRNVDGYIEFAEALKDVNDYLVSINLGI